MILSHRDRFPASLFRLALLLMISGNARAEESSCDVASGFAGSAAVNGMHFSTCISALSPLPIDRKNNEVINGVAAVKPNSPNSAEAHLARAQIEWDALNWIEALRSYNQAVALEPQNIKAQEGRLLVLSKMHLPSEALVEAAKIPGVSSAVTQRLHEDEAALVIRWSEKVYYAKPGEQFPMLDRAIAMTEINLKRYPSSVRSRLDYVRALNNRQRNADAIVAYEHLQRDDIAIPAYVHQSAGSAYLATKHPEQAAVAFRLALAGDPDDSKANLGLFYTLIDLSDFPAAQRHIDTYAARKNLPSDKFAAVMAAIMERAFENRLDVAQARLQALSDEAPASESLRLAEAKIALWRGRPRKAHALAQQVTLREVDDLQANVLLVDTETVLGDYASADARLAKLYALVPEDPDVNNLRRAAEVRAMNEIALSVSGTRSRENLGSGQGVVVDMRAFGRPLGGQARPFVHTYYERATSDGGAADYRRLGAGIDYVFPRTANVRVELQQEFFLQPRTSLQVSGRADLNDYWSLSGLIDSNSIEVPLRARYDAIGGNEVQAGVTYRLSERLSFSASVTRLNMTDGNLRRAIGLQTRANLIQGPYYKGTLEAAFSASRNNLEGANYFNPSSSQTTELSWINEWMNYQRYNRSFGQQLALSVGRAAEAGFATGTIGAIRYVQRLSFSDTLALNYGVGVVRRIYTGVLSTGPEADLSFNWKL